MKPIKINLQWEVQPEDLVDFLKKLDRAGLDSKAGGNEGFSGLLQGLLNTGIGILMKRYGLNI